MPRRAFSLAPSLILAIAVLTGCGSSSNGVASKPPKSILSAATTAARNASSVHVTAVSHVGPALVTLTGTLGKKEGRAKIELYGYSFEAIRNGASVFVKGNQSFTARLDQTLGVKIPAGRWLKAPTTGALSEIAAYTDENDELPVILGMSGPITKGASANLNGQPTIILHETARLYNGTLYVATTGQPYPLLQRKTGQEVGETKFTDWNKPVTVDPPAEAVELSQLRHEGA